MRQGAPAKDSMGFKIVVSIFVWEMMVVCIHEINLKKIVYK